MVLKSLPLDTTLKIVRRGRLLNSQQIISRYPNLLPSLQGQLISPSRTVSEYSSRRCDFELYLHTDKQCRLHIIRLPIRKDIRHDRSRDTVHTSAVQTETRHQRFPQTPRYYN